MASELAYCYAVSMDGLHEPISQHTRTLAGNHHQVHYENFKPSTPVSEDCIDVAFEIDFDYFQKQGGEFVTSSSEEASCTEGPHMYGEEEVKQCLVPRRRRKQKVTTDKVPKKTSRTRAPIRPSQRNAANARERSRMRVLSKAFTKLKTSLPWVPADTKLSKLDTLRLASCYIAHLQRVLQNENDDGPIHPVNLTWPFAAGIRHQSASHSSSSSSSSSSEGSSLS